MCGGGGRKTSGGRGIAKEGGEEVRCLVGGGGPIMTCVHAKRSSVVIGGRSVSVVRVDSLWLWLSLFIAGGCAVGGFGSDTVVLP